MEIQDRTTVDIKELNERIQRESAFVDLINMELGKVIIGQKKHGRAFVDWPHFKWAYPP